MVCSLFFTGVIYAQVGVNTASPKANLDIIGKNGATDIDGVLPPRITRAELTAKGDTVYGAGQNGVVIYITDVTGGDALSQRMHINEKGYYFFDAGVNSWQKIITNPWNVIGGTTQVSTNTEDIYQNGNVGIGDFSATAPTQKLDIDGSVRVRNIEDGSVRVNYPYDIVASTDGTLAASKGNNGMWRYATNNTLAVMTDFDHILNIGSSTVSTITLPPNPKVGRIVTIRIDGHVSGTYTVATPGITPAGYLPMNYTTVGIVTAASYKNTIKPKTAVELVWTGYFGSGGLGWVQIGGENQMETTP